MGGRGADGAPGDHDFSHRALCAGEARPGWVALALVLEAMSYVVMFRPIFLRPLVMREQAGRRPGLLPLVHRSSESPLGGSHACSHVVSNVFPRSQRRRRNERQERRKPRLSRTFQCAQGDSNSHPA